MQVRTLGLVIIALVLAVASITMLSNGSVRPHGEVTVQDAELAPAPQSRELRRCRDLGETAVDDQACKRIWEENRRRFLGLDDAMPPQTAGDR